MLPFISGPPACPFPTLFTPNSGVSRHPRPFSVLAATLWQPRRAGRDGSGCLSSHFIGAQLLLLPGLLFGAWLTFKERRTGLIFIWLWWVGFLLLYGLRLPVTYQHGRYQIPAIAWVILLGVWGTARLLQKVPRRNIAMRALSRAWVLSLAVLVLAFVVIGRRLMGGMSFYRE